MGDARRGGEGCPASRVLGAPGSQVDAGHQRQVGAAGEEHGEGRQRPQEACRADGGKTGGKTGGRAGGRTGGRTGGKTGRRVAQPNGKEQGDEHRRQPGQAVKLLAQPGDHQAAGTEQTEKEPFEGTEARLVRHPSHQHQAAGHGRPGQAAGRQRMAPAAIVLGAERQGAGVDGGGREQEEPDPGAVLGAKGPRQPEDDPQKRRAQGQAGQVPPLLALADGDQTQLKHQQIGKEQTRARISAADQHRRQEAAHQADDRHQNALTQGEKDGCRGGQSHEHEAHRRRHQLVEVDGGEEGDEERRDGRRRKALGDVAAALSQVFARGQQRQPGEHPEDDADSRRQDALVDGQLDEIGRRQYQGGGADPNRKTTEEPFLDADLRLRRGLRLCFGWGEAGAVARSSGGW